LYWGPFWFLSISSFLTIMTSYFSWRLFSILVMRGSRLGEVLDGSRLGYASGYGGYIDSMKRSSGKSFSAWLLMKYFSSSSELLPRFGIMSFSRSLLS
jgi:hypothetical protein